MWMLLLGVICVFLASSRSEPLQGNNRSCSHAGVFLAQGKHQYSLSCPMAQKGCEHFGATLASQEQVKEAYTKGMQTCRYGWMNNGRHAILRHSPGQKCAIKTGFLVFQPCRANELYDAYCFEDKVGPEMNCEKTFGKLNAGVSKFTRACLTLKPQPPKMPGPGERFVVVQYQEPLPCCRKISNYLFQDIIWYWQWKICLYRQQTVTKCRLEIEKY